MKKTLAFLALILVFSMLWLAGCDEDKKAKILPRLKKKLQKKRQKQIPRN